MGMGPYTIQPLLTLDEKPMSVEYQISLFKHVHNEEGRCIKNIDDVFCDAKPDTFPQWLYHRLKPLRQDKTEWEALSEEDRQYWEHEAAAVRRAVARNGFKNA